jgi:hypothetical protein
MPFVSIQVALFVIWMLFIESDPWPKLTLIVSLEAIFLSTFVMIGRHLAHQAHWSHRMAAGRRAGLGRR